MQNTTNSAAKLTKIKTNKKVSLNVRAHLFQCKAELSAESVVRSPVIESQSRFLSASIRSAPSRVLLAKSVVRSIVIESQSRFLSAKVTASCALNEKRLSITSSRTITQANIYAQVVRRGKIHESIRSLTIDETISFWCKMYRSGIRITYKENRFVYESVDWMRIHKTKLFGLFSCTEIDPPVHVVLDVELHKDQLIKILTQPVPADLVDWWYHPLDANYEGVPLLQMAAARGQAVHLIPCSLGVWPLCVNLKPEEKTTLRLPALSRILINAGYAYFEPAYRA